MIRDSLELRQAVLGQVNGWLGTPFVTRGAVRGAGVDCGSLLIVCYGAAGVPVPPLDGLGHFPLGWHQHATEERYLNILKQFSREVSEPRPGDMALFKMGKVWAHSSIVIEWPVVAHTMWKGKVELSDATKPPLSNRAKPLFLSPFE